MTDLAHDSDNRQIEREISITQGIIARRQWCATYLDHELEINDWPEERIYEFFAQMPTIPLDLFGSGIQ